MDQDLTRTTIEGPHLTTTEVHKVTETPRNSQDKTTTQMLSLIQGEETLETSSMELVLDSIQEISKVEMIDHTCQRSSTTIQDQVTLKSMTNMSERIDLATMLATEISELKSSGTSLSRIRQTSRTMNSKWSGSSQERTVRIESRGTTEIDLKPINESPKDLRDEASSKNLCNKICFF